MFIVLFLVGLLVGGGQTTGNLSRSVFAYTAVSDNAVELTDIGPVFARITAFDTVFNTPQMTWSDDACTVAIPGYYFIAVYASFSGTNNRTFTCQAFVNNSVPIQGLLFRRRLQANDVALGAFGGIVLLEEGDAVDVKCRGEAPGDDILILDATYSLMGVGY